MDKCDPANFAITDTRTLIILLQTPDPPTCVQALEALTKFAEHNSKRRVQLLNLNIMKPLLSLTTSKEVSIKKAAVACIAASTELAEIHPEMRRKDLLETIVTLLAVEEPPEVQDEAAFAVANLAKDFALKSDIRKAGGIKALVKLLPSTDPDVKKNVALALSSLLEDFTNRSEIRYVNGLAPLLELLGAEFPEIQENTLMSLILCAEDHSNRVEIRKLNGVKRLIDMLSQDLPELHHWTLFCLSKCLEDTETVNIFPEIGGLPPIMKMLASEDVRNKRNACLVLSKAAKTDRNQTFIRDAGALPILTAMLAHADPGVISHAAMSLGHVAKNELTQLELNKVGLVDTIIKLIAHEDADICRQAAFALSSLCLNAKTRLKVKTTESIGPIMRLLTLEDPQTLVNASECIANLAEDTANRLDIVKLGGVNALLAILSKPETSVQAAACLAIARCMQEGEARISLTKDKKTDNVAKLISLVLSKDVSVARNAAYALSNAAQYESNAVLFCQMGAIEALLALGKDAAKSSQKFSRDALDKLLNYHLSAKYWLRNELSSDNIIKTGFYDLGSAGNNLEHIKGLPTLQDLKAIPLDKRREVIVIDHEKDGQFQSLCQSALQNLSNFSPRQQIRQIATIVSSAMGGPIEPAALSEFAFKFKVTELKMKAESNVLPIGQIAAGTFYHRALLFKAICDKIGLGPCHLVRGDYNRAWNVVDVRKLELVKVRVSSAPSGGKKLPPSREPAVGGGGGMAMGGLASAATPAMVSGGTSVLPAGWQPQSEPTEFPEEVTIVDLVFEPGRLLGVTHDHARRPTSLNVRICATAANQLESCKPLLTKQELERTTAAVQTFSRSGDFGDVLQNRLKALDAKEEKTYLEWREPSLINVNWWCQLVDPVDGLVKTPRESPITDFQLKRAAGFISNMLDFKVLVDQLGVVLFKGHRYTQSLQIIQGIFDAVGEEGYSYTGPIIHLIRKGSVLFHSWLSITCQRLLPQEYIKGEPLCMNQYTNMFALRVFLVKKRTQSHQHPATYIIALVRDQMYKIDVIAKDGSLDKDSWMGERQAPVSVLTGGHRDTNFKGYSRLQSLSQQNAQNLELIRTSLFAVCLDTKGGYKTLPEETHGQIFHNYDGYNRWFDKALQLIVLPNGRAGVNGEHTPTDAVIPGRLMDYVVKTCLLQTDVYGSQYIKNSAKASPDAHVQIALHLAWRRLQEPTAVYESASIRLFKHGRTKTIRSLTQDTWKFATTFDDSSVTVDEKRVLFGKAIKSQSHMTKEATFERGVDRHLLALRTLIQSPEEQQIATLFTDPAYIKSMYFKLSTSNMSPGTWDTFYGEFGPVVPQNYGLNYAIGKDNLKFSISTLLSNDRCSKV
ncbi:UNVERIFIED_CONTAM: hypothetical protein HDU68_011024 [Siphonaria sp. JEL0065]|nr:hypothetical protein HDU68_011024 [Siphonaria sp. JEL0065]